MLRRLQAGVLLVALLAHWTGPVLGSAQAATPWPTNADVDYQLGGATAPASRVTVVARDRTAPPAAGAYNICYVNGFQTQPGERALWRRHPGLVLRQHGTPVVDPGWPDEWLLDLRTARKRTALARVVDRWVARCAADGFDAVEFDNLDSWTRSGGMLSARQAKAYARLLVRSAHRHGLWAGQKNWASWNGTRVGFDFAVAESCGRWDECADYSRHYGRRWIDIEYRARDFRKACRSVGSRIGVVLRDRDLTVRGPRRWC